MFHVETVIEGVRSAHPTLVTAVNGTARAACSLHLVAILPVAVLADRYQLADLHAESKLISSGHDPLPPPEPSMLRLTGHQDLESPVYRLESQNTIIVLDLPASAETLTVRLPLHIRYIAPQPRPGRAVTVPIYLNEPYLAETCVDADGPTELNALAWQPAEIQKEVLDLLPAPTLRIHGGIRRLVLAAPSGASRDLAWVEQSHFAIVWGAFLLLLHKAWRSR